MFRSIVTVVDFLPTLIYDHTGVALAVNDGGRKGVAHWQKLAPKRRGTTSAVANLALLHTPATEASVDVLRRMSRRKAGAGLGGARVPRSRHHRRPRTSDALLPSACRTPMSALAGSAHVRRHRQPRRPRCATDDPPRKNERHGDNNPISASGAQGPSKRRRSLLPGRAEVFKMFTLRTPPNMARRATCLVCGWDRGAVFARLKAHAETHANELAPGAAVTAAGVPGATATQGMGLGDRNTASRLSGSVTQANAPAKGNVPAVPAHGKRVDVDAGFTGGVPAGAVPDSSVDTAFKGDGAAVATHGKRTDSTTPMCCPVVCAEDARGSSKPRASVARCAPRECTNTTPGARAGAAKSRAPSSHGVLSHSPRGSLRPVCDQGCCRCVSCR